MTTIFLILVLAPLFILTGFFLYFAWKASIVIWKMPMFNLHLIKYSLLGPFSLFFMPSKVKSKMDEPWYVYKKMMLRAIGCLLGCLAYALLLRGLFELA